MAPHALLSVLVKSTSSRRIGIEPVDDSADCASLRVVRGVVVVISNKPLDNSLTSVSDKPLLARKRTIVAHVTDRSSNVIATGAALLENNPETRGAVHYKPTVNRDTQMARQKYVEAKDDYNLKLHWKCKVQLSGEYAEYQDQFVSMLTEIQSM